MLLNFLNLNKIIKLIIAITIVRQSVIESCPSWKQMAIIIATEVILTASKKAENSFEFFNFLTIGFNNATNIKDGRKIPSVDTIAPIKPLI